MFWRKSWWDTRLLWAVAFAMMLFVLALGQPWRAPDLARWVESLQRNAANWGDDPQEITTLFNSYYAYFWRNYFKLLLLILWPWAAMLSGASLLFSSLSAFGGAMSGAAQFTHSLPVTRRRVLLTHTAVLATGLTALSIVPSLLMALCFQVTGATVPLSKVLVHALLLVAGGLAFPMLSLLLTVSFKNHAVYFVIGLSSVFACLLPLRSLREHPWWHIFHVMSGDTYFRYGQIPWLGLLFWLSVAALFLLLAVRNYERREF